VVAWRGYRHGERLAGVRTEHEREMAREARRYQRLTEAYVPVLDFAFKVGQWSELVRPMIQIGEVKPPPLPSLDEQAHVQALIAAYASPEVKQLMLAWREHLNNVRKADMTIGFAQQHDARGHIDDGAEWLKLEQEYRPAERQARQALADQVSHELGEGPREIEPSSSRRWLSQRRSS
jgi:hypothetical protein